MTWNVSLSGPKDEVKKKVEEKVTGFHQHPEVTEAINKALDAVKGTQVSVSGSGYDQGFSLNVSSWVEESKTG